MAARRYKVWRRAYRAPTPAIPDADERRRIIDACERLIRDVLQPRYLPEIKPTERNYPIYIHGAYAAGRYRFIQRFRSGHAESRGLEFDSPFARLDRMGPDCFNLQWMRHTGEWWPLHRGVTFEEALRLPETNGLLHPIPL
jgi:hypothetical protein